VVLGRSVVDIQSGRAGTGAGEEESCVTAESCTNTTIGSGSNSKKGGKKGRKKGVLPVTRIPIVVDGTDTDIGNGSGTGIVTFSTNTLDSVSLPNPNPNPVNVSDMFASSDACWSTLVKYTEPQPNTRTSAYTHNTHIIPNSPMVCARVVDPASDVVMELTYRHAAADIVQDGTVTGVGVVASPVVPSAGCIVNGTVVLDADDKRPKKRLKSIGQSKLSTVCVFVYICHYISLTI